MKAKGTLLTVLNYSGGVQSTAILELVLNGTLKVDLDTFVVLRADPGMEDSRTYEHCAAMEKRLDKAGIYHGVAAGPSLYKDLISIPTSGRTRVDNPPYWVKRPSGKTGQLMQKCTSEYKIRPMDRFIRREMNKRYGYNLRGRLPPKSVVKMIGFALDEQHRIKEPSVQYQAFRYPLVEMGLDRAAIEKLFKDNKWPKPPRSVCVACFANGSAHFLDMQEHRPKDFKKACLVDETIRDHGAKVGINGEIYVSRSLVPLRKLKQEANEWSPELQEANSCDSGYCFT